MFEVKVEECTISCLFYAGVLKVLISMQGSRSSAKRKGIYSNKSWGGVIVPRINGTVQRPLTTLKEERYLKTDSGFVHTYVQVFPPLADKTPSTQACQTNRWPRNHITMLANQKPDPHNLSCRLTRGSDQLFLHLLLIFATK